MPRLWQHHILSVARIVGIAVLLGVVLFGGMWRAGFTQDLPSGQASGLQRGSVAQLDPRLRDPAAWRKLDISNTPLAPGAITALFEDSTGRIWVGTSEGISVYATGTWRTYTKNDGIAEGRVTDIVEDGAGRIWIATMGESPGSSTEGVSVYTEGNWTTVVSGFVYRIFRDSQGWVWIARYNQLMAYGDDAWHDWTFGEQLPGGSLNAVLEDSKGRIWVGTGLTYGGDEVGGVSRFDRQDWTTLPISGSVTGIQQTDGVIWISTEGTATSPGPLYAVDYESLDLLPDLSHNPFAADINIVMKDAENNLWAVLTRRSSTQTNTYTSGPSGAVIGAADTLNVAVHDQAGWRQISTQIPVSGSVTPLLRDRRGAVWFGINDPSNAAVRLMSYDGAAWYTYGPDDGLATGYVRVLTETHNGLLWAAGNEGLAIFAGGQWTQLPDQATVPAGTVPALLEDSQGRIWVGASEAAGQAGSLFVFTGGPWQKPRLAAGDLYLADMLEDSCGNVWVGLNRSVDSADQRYEFEPVVAVLRGSAWTTYTVGAGLPNGAITGLVEDKAGNIWVSTSESFMSAVGVPGGDRGDGVRVFNGLEWVLPPNAERLPEGGVSQLQAGVDGRIWVAVGDNYREGTLASFQAGDWLIHEAITQTPRFMWDDPNGDFWTANSTAVQRYHNGSWITYDAGSGLAGSDDADGVNSPSIQTRLVTRDGRLWVGLGNGIKVYDGNQWLDAPGAQEFVNEGASKLFEDSRGRIWVVAFDSDENYSKHLRAYDGTSWQDYVMGSDGLADGYVSVIFEDNGGRIWIGTDNYPGVGELSVLEGGRWRSISVREGSPPGAIMQIHQDAAGQVWFASSSSHGSYGGVSSLGPAGWSSYGPDVLPSGGIGTLWEDSQRRLWIGAGTAWNVGSSGLAYRQPGSELPWVFIRNILAGSDRNVVVVDNPALSGMVSMPPGTNRVRVEFAGADLGSLPREVYYRYKLEGYDPDWQYTRTPLVQYTNLEPGSYNFIAQTINLDGVSSPEATLAITIAPYLWQLPWIWFTVGAGALALVIAAPFSIRRYRRQRALAAWQTGLDPYIVGADIKTPAKFYGREEVLADLTRYLRSGNHVAIHGDRRIGKTSLLHQLKHRLQMLYDREFWFLPVFISLEMVSEQNLFRVIAAQTAKEARTRFTVGPLLADTPADPYNSLDLAEDIEAINAAWQLQDRRALRIVLLLDEGDQLNSFDPHIPQSLRGFLMQPAGAGISLVWSGKNLNQEWRLNTSPFYNLFRDHVRLDGIDRDSAIRLITEPVRGVFRFSDEAIEQILAVTGSRPYEIQRICSDCVKRLLREHKTVVSAADVDFVVERLAANPLTGAASDEPTVH